MRGRVERSPYRAAEPPETRCLGSMVRERRAATGTGGPAAAPQKLTAEEWKALFQIGGQLVQCLAIDGIGMMSYL